MLLGLPGLSLLWQVKNICGASSSQLYSNKVLLLLKSVRWPHVFSGIGYATQIVIAYAAVSYIVIQAWAFFYLFSSFSAEVPWASCRNPWNTGACAHKRSCLHNSSSASPRTQICMTLGKNLIQHYFMFYWLLDWYIHIRFVVFFSQSFVWSSAKKMVHPTWRCLRMQRHQPQNSGSKCNLLFCSNSIRKEVSKSLSGFSVSPSGLFMVCYSWWRWIVIALINHIVYEVVTAKSFAFWKHHSIWYILGMESY